MGLKGYKNGACLVRLYFSLAILQDRHHGLALISAMLGKPISGVLVVLGQVSIHGLLSSVEGLGDKLCIATDAGAKRAIFLTENKRDFSGLPAGVIDKLQIDVYSDPAKAVFKALAEV